MSEQQFYKLDKYIDHLIEVCQKLRQENQSLKKIQHQLMAERDGLLHKNDIARAKIETMLNKLKALEATP